MSMSRVLQTNPCYKEVTSSSFEKHTLFRVEMYIGPTVGEIHKPEYATSMLTHFCSFHIVYIVDYLL